MSEMPHAHRKVAARLQAFMGNDPRLKESGQWKGQTKMSKRGVETLRTAFFQAAFSAAQHDPDPAWTLLARSTTNTKRRKSNGETNLVVSGQRTISWKWLRWWARA
jgi:transposase